MTGSWSDPVKLYTTVQQGPQWNYAGHAYNGFDGTDRTLLGYTVNGSCMGTARVTWQ